MPGSIESRSTDEDTAEASVENRDAGEEVARDQMALVEPLVGDDDTHRQIVPVRDSRDCTSTRTRESQRSNHKCDRIPVEREVVVGCRTEQNCCAVCDGRIERTIERDADKTVNRDDGVLRTRNVAESHHLADIGSHRETADGDFLRPASRVTTGVVDGAGRSSRNCSTAGYC